jgi:hypothetical protein
MNEPRHNYSPQEAALIMRVGQLRRDLDLLLEVQGRTFDRWMLDDFAAMAAELNRVSDEVAAFVEARREKAVTGKTKKGKSNAPRKSHWN